MKKRKQKRQNISKVRKEFPKKKKKGRRLKKSGNLFFGLFAPKAQRREGARNRILKEGKRKAEKKEFGGRKARKNAPHKKIGVSLKKPKKTRQKKRQESGIGKFLSGLFKEKKTDALSEERKESAEEKGSEESYSKKEPEISKAEAKAEEFGIRQDDVNVKKEKKAKAKKEPKPKILPKDSGQNSGKDIPNINYIKTNIPGFDALLEKGVPEGSSVLVEGGPGSGKTIFCLALARNMCKEGKKVLYMSFEEPEYRLRSHLKNFGTDVEELERKKLLYIKRFNALDIARSVEALLSEAKKELLIDVQPVLIPHDFEPEIVLIDSLTSIGSAFSGEESRFRVYMEQLFRYLESHQITSFLIRETSSPTHVGTSFVEKAEAVSFLSDGIIAMYNVFLTNGLRKRAIEIIKMRGVHINRRIVECSIIEGKGMVVYPKKTLKGKYTLT